MKKQSLKYILILSLIMPYAASAEMMHSYQNKIIDIQDIQGTSTYTLILTCEEPNPIAVYAPETYQDSLNPELTTIFMPRTTLAQDVEEVPGMVEVTGEGITIFLRGNFKGKLVADHKMSVTVEVVP